MTAADNRRITALAADRAVHRAFQWLHLHSRQLVQWQLEMLAIPAPPFQEKARAQWFLHQFLKLNLHTPHVDKEGNVLAELPASNLSPDAPVVLLSAHLDTVFPPGTNTTPHLDDPREQGEGIIHGPGACDNAAGLTALLALAAALKHAELTPTATILFCANVGEEGPGDLRGMRHLFGQSPYASRIRTALALEGAGTATIVDRALGSRRLRVAISGPGGHSWADAGRPNPILTLASGLLSIANLRLPAHPRTTLNIGTIAGGTSVNSIPESATADLDLRSTAAAELDRIELSILRTLTETLAIENRDVPPALQLSLRVARTGDRPAGVLAATTPLAHSLHAVDRHLNITTEPHIGSTDANLPLSLGIPALAIGAGGTGTGIHTLAESYDPTGRDLALRRILLLLLDACTLITQT
ncbi:M20/M25/M40 family metallo-hydrolase [Granulicella sp. 5B5]|uniref:M20/M25/M40 family metallo-hydrolase n=1 Tax=Granulicella sp. 5B5 TaxID=1617967 RepID=UPI0015F3BD06|nr:M20/M25/M40 family metallo-hydrolase [Granulicella sp. 5B5]QMV17368.1 M20/M25/M40 family metallo-hydrolase [Granulicella sp. 5B5]